MIVNIDKLASVIAAYDIDSPHFNEDQLYTPEVPIKEWLTLEHEGDCINLPAPCRRCFAEEIYCKVKYIINNYEQ